MKLRHLRHLKPNRVDVMSVRTVCLSVINQYNAHSLLPVVLRLQEVELLLNPVYRLADGELEGRGLPAVAAAAGRLRERGKETKKNAIKRLNLGRPRSPAG